MKTFARLLSLGLFCLTFVGLARPAWSAANPSSASGPEDLIRILTDLKLPAGEEVNDAVVLFGRGTTEGTVHRNFFSLGSDVEVNGPIDHDLTILFGKVKLGPKAEVGGHAAFIGCEVERSPEAKFKRTPKELFTASQFPQLHWVTEYLGQGALRLRPLPPGVTWVWAVAAMLALIYLLMQVLFPAPVAASVSALQTRPVTALFSGLVVSIVVAPVCVLLVATGVGVLLLPLVLVAFVGALLLGKTAALRFVGHQLGRQMKLNLLENAVLALVVGGGLVTLLYMVPVLGVFMWGGLTLLGLGSTVVAGVQHLGKESEAAAPLAPRATVDTANAAGEAALPRVGFWRRFVATLLDAVLIGATAGVLSKGLLLLPAWFLYHLIMWRWKGTTIGGIVFGLKLMREDGRPVTLAVALVRSLASLFSLIALGLGFFWAGWSRDKRAWHDRIAGTIIVQMPRGMSLI